MQVFLKNQQRNPVTLATVERDDEVAVIGITDHGKRFVARREMVGEPMPKRHRYRVYLHNGDVARVVDPSFEQAEADLLAAVPDDAMTFRSEDGEYVTFDVRDISSILSATPEDRARAGEQVDAAEPVVA